MRIEAIECKIFNDSEFDSDYEVETLFLDLDLVGAFHMADNKDCTIVYISGSPYELLINILEFARLKTSTNLTAPSMDRFLSMFSNN